MQRARQPANSQQKRGRRANSSAHTRRRLVKALRPHTSFTMSLCTTHIARAVKGALQRPVARAMLTRSRVGVARAATPPHASQHARASIPYYLSMLPAGQRGAFSTTAAAGAAPVVTQPIVLVKIGVDGNDSSLPLTYDSLADMDRMALLEELAKSVRFSAELKDVPLSKCTVWLLPRVTGDEPTPQEEDAAVELRAAATIGDVLTAQKWTPSRLLFMRVHFGAPPVRGHEPLDASLNIPQRIWDTLPQRVQKRALQNNQLRSKLTKVQTLMGLQDWKAGSSWPSDVVNLMPASTSDASQLGVLRLPSVKEPFFENPKGFQDLLHSPCDLILDASRVELASDFIRAMRAPVQATNYGVLLSGPNGVGKSAVGLLTFLACYAQGLSVVYISNTASWTLLVSNKEHGSRYLLEQFIAQNTDIILANEMFRALFLPILRDEARLTPDFLERLGHLTLNGAPRVGIILDEVQYITQAAEDITRAGGQYFRESWYVWSTATTAPFVRMDIASSHGLREFKLPSGEEHRLRFVKPWPKAIRDAFLSNTASPGFMENAAVRDRAVFVGGGVVRTLLRFKALLPPKAKVPSDWAGAEGRIRDMMHADSELWLRKLVNEADRREATSVIRNLILGQVTWGKLKPLYDEGLVELTDAGHVAPVSLVAASVLHGVLAREFRHHATRICSLPETGERGYELENQLHALLDRVRTTIPVVTLASTRAESVYIRTDFALPFSRIDKALRAHATAGPVLYLPKSPNYAVDAIIAPMETDDDDPAVVDKLPVLVIEMSMTHPRQSKRVGKMLKWFRPDGVLQQLSDVYTDRKIVIVCCYGDEYAAEHANSDKYLEVVRAADAMGVSVVVADRPSLEALGVLF